MGGLVHGLLPVVPLRLCRLGFAVATHTTSQGEKGDWNKKARAYCQGPDGNACIDLFRLQALQCSRRSCGWSRGPLGFIPAIFFPFVSFFVFASILPEFSVFLPFCILACNFLSLFYSRISRLLSTFPYCFFPAAMLLVTFKSILI
jgi:hypothetical protein